MKMSENNGGTNLGFFLAGLGMGAILALLFAPQSGKETRDLIAQKATEGKDYVAGRSRELRQQAEELVDKGKERFAKEKERVSGAVDAARQAYREEKSKA
jgi:gas vesicle protein